MWSERTAGLVLSQLCSVVVGIEWFLLPDVIGLVRHTNHLVL